MRARTMIFLASAATLAACTGAGDTGPTTSTSSSTTSGATGGGGSGGTPATYTDPPAVQGRLKKTLDDLAAFGAKRAGTEGGKKAGDYVKKRFEDAGFTGVSFESFHFLSFELASSSLAVTLDGAAAPMSHEVFQYSGKGHVDADVIDVGKGHDGDYTGKDLTGKIALVERDATFHREAQYKAAAAHGAVAMLYVSTSPQNLIQIGTVSDPEDGLATIPTITVGADDGKKIKDALAAGKAAHAVIDVDASIAPADGRNVIARWPGTDPSGAYVVIGAHYDTWYTGSTDNGTGTAVLLEVAEALRHGPQQQIGVVFVGYDGEELGLFGGYDYLRRHVIQANEPMLAFINLEMPGNGTEPDATRAMARTNDGPMSAIAAASDASNVYSLFIGMEVVPQMFGGLIPTDIQGMYWGGLQGATTYCDSPYYHTTEDTPDKVDLGFLAKGAMAIARMSAACNDYPLTSFHKRDDQVWFPAVQQVAQGNGDVQVTVTAQDRSGTAQPGARVAVWVDVDDFTRAFRVAGTADGAGKLTVTVPKSALAQGAGGRFLHVTTGKSYPQSEQIFPLP